MYSPRVVDARRLEYLRAFHDALPPGDDLSPTPLEDVYDWLERLSTAFAPTGEPLRALTPDEDLFIARERLLVKIDVRYWLQRYCVINLEGAASGPLYPLWPSQSLILDHLGRLEERAYFDNEPYGLIVAILKSRQLGASTLSEALVAHRVTTHGHVQALIASDTTESSARMFRMSTRIIRSLPFYLRPVIIDDVKNAELSFTNESRLEVGAGKSTRGTEGKRGQLGRSGTFSCAHLSELSTWEHLDQIFDATFPAIPIAPTTLILMESTAKGRHDAWHGVWEMACRGTGPHGHRFSPLFIPWYAVPDKNALPPPADWSPSGHTLHVARVVEETSPQWMGQRITPTREQLYWYEQGYRAAEHQERTTHPGSLSKFLEEQCLAQGTRISTTRGLIPIEEVVVGDVTESGVVTRTVGHGPQPVVAVETVHGRRLILTANHPVAVRAAFVPAANLVEGMPLQLPALQSSIDYARLTWAPLPGYTSTIVIDESWARFLGYFAGDGCYYHGRVAFAVNWRDEDVIEELRGLLLRLSGCVAKIVRKGAVIASVSVNTLQWLSPLQQLGVIKQRSDAYFVRRVCVPEVIWRSPRTCQREFLSALFEADGHAYTGTARATVFTNYIEFARDILLLLQVFDVRGYLKKQVSRKPGGKTFTGWSVEIKGVDADRFHDVIGFRSARKRLSAARSIRPRARITDVVARVIPQEDPRPVYDLTVERSHVFGANGVLVHNCSTPEEAFQHAGRSIFPLLVRERLRAAARPLLAAYELLPAKDLAFQWGRRPALDYDAALDTALQQKGLSLDLWSADNPSPPRLTPQMAAFDPSTDPIVLPAGMGMRRLPPAELLPLLHTPLLDGLHGLVLLYERPRPDQLYTIAADVSEGIGQDASVATVLRVGTVREPDEEVAQILSPHMDPKDLAYAIDVLGKLYTGRDSLPALVAVEVTGIGIDCQSELLRHYGYTNLFIWQYEDAATVEGMYTKRFGWYTTIRTRPIIISRVIRAVKSVDPVTQLPDIRVNSPFTLRDLDDFQQPPGGSISEACAASGASDDAVMALAVALHVAQTLQFEQGEPVADRRHRLNEQAFRAHQAGVAQGQPQTRRAQNTAVTAEQAEFLVGMAYEESEYDETGAIIDGWG